jgi:hypothetical protein
VAPPAGEQLASAVQHRDPPPASTAGIDGTYDKDPTRRALVGTLQKLWIELGNKERLLSEQHVLKEMEGLSIGTPKAGVGERGG